jgi:hypothetical protein
MGRKWYAIWVAAGLLGGLAAAWYLEPSTLAGSAILAALGALAGLILGFIAAAFVPVRAEAYTWTGISGRSYHYAILDLHVKFAEHQVLPGNFGFVKMVDGVSCPLFFGETPDGVERQPSRHVAWDEAVGLGATHIHWRRNDDEGARLREVDDLVAKYAPPLNRRMSLSG